MQHAKKMILIPEDAVEKLQRATSIPVDQPATVQTPGNILSRLDAEMTEILRSATPANEHEKWKLYQQVLQRYQFFTNENRRNTFSKDTKTDEAEEDSTEEDERIANETIIASVPGKYKKQAEQLLQFLNSSSVRSAITWDKVGAVSINGERIKDANIIDLVNDAMRSRKTVKAIGRSQFGAELRRVGVPREYIGNHSLLYENLSLSPPAPPSSAATPQTNFYATRSNQSTPRSTRAKSPKQRTPTSTAVKLWRTLNL